ncbi:asparagine--tRNA ligase [Scheffersomyces spartinae]|uniref:asparagine--tRNA ligase n=1 Tax=Scheffersomyces spartinae TaxID=45513 RepID=A0A9P8AJV1_9ASCO|nr:asparagine--tRNA ligase [Scheffersomyces spartinae]KAG7194477.1 asparagine--tRNA ligase [Scheffersomyces spartinae]
MSKVYVNEKTGADSASAAGSEEQPFQTPAYALFVQPEATVLVFKQLEDSEEFGYVEISASALKKAKKGAESLKKKQEKQALLDAQKQQKEAEAAKKLAELDLIEINEDASLPAAVPIKVRNVQDHLETRVVVQGWVHRFRLQKGLAFLTIRDGSGLIQAVLSGDLAKWKVTQQLTLESTIAIKGMVHKLPEGKTAPGGVELQADFYQVIGLAPAGDDSITNKVPSDASPSLLMDNRHLALRGDALSAVMKVRAALLKSVRRFFDEENLTEVTPPCMVQTQVEGGSTLFKMSYYGEDAFLTQSSQLYLETCLPSLGDVYCIQESFRAEQSHTRRHLSEYTHIESELAFISFDDMLNHLERLLTKSVEYVLADPIAGPLVKQLNPNFVAPKQPFKRMEYIQALEWLNEHEIPNEEGEKFKFGDDIAEAAERRMVDTIGVPIFLIRFPAEIKSFYMKRCKDDPRVTESVDVLMPNVGEIVGGSMRMEDYDELMTSMKKEGLDPTPYYWFLDLRKYGTCPHGGYGLGTERILAWLCDRFTVRDCSLYPRFTGRCKP